MSRQVRETKAGKSVSAWVITKGFKGIVATVHAHYGDTGNVMVDVWDTGRLTYQGRAGGYGYDKFIAALAGAEIQGIKISGQCEEQKNKPRGKKCFPGNSKAPKGFHFANWNSQDNGWASCYRIAGLEILEAYGFTVHRVI